MAIEIKNKNKVVLGIFQSLEKMETAIEMLRTRGFRNADVSALVPTNETTKEFAHENTTKLPEGTATGGIAGGILGGTVGWLIGAGSIVVPGLGAFIAAGPIMSMLAGAALGTAVGGVSGALIGIGIPEFEARRYEGFVKNGGYLLSVHCDNSEWANKAEDILEEFDAEEISAIDEATSNSDLSIKKDIPRELNSSNTTVRPNIYR